MNVRINLREGSSTLKAESCWVSQLLIAVCGEVSFTVDNDGCAFNPFGAIVRDPGACGPLANIISAREDSRSLDVSDLDDVFVLGKYVSELLTGCTMSHRPVDVLQNFSSVSWAVA